MKVYIQTDIEGVAGWASFEDRITQTIDNYEHRQRMYRLLTGEVNAAVRAARACGAETIYINDNHGSAYNIIFEELEEGCEILHGRGGHSPEWLTSLNDGFDALVLIGMHAMGGELGAVCPHSRWVLNDGEAYLSEASMAMALAGDLNIPAVFVSGDQVITEEVREKNPAIETAVVKHAYGPFFCRSVLPRKAQELIFTGVAKGLENRKNVLPYKPEGPFTLNLLDNDGHIPPLKPVLKKPVTGATVTEVFQKALSQFPWSSYGKQIMDYYRYPGNLAGKKPAVEK
ncbi:MAG: M55 family metallopeptidase [Candidatus Omnitrophota bacterium]